MTVLLIYANTVITLWHSNIDPGVINPWPAGQTQHITCFCKESLIGTWPCHLFTSLGLLSAAMTVSNSLTDHMAQKPEINGPLWKKFVDPWHLSSMCYCTGQVWQSLFLNCKSFAEQILVASFQFVPFKYWLEVCLLMTPLHCWALWGLTFPT